ncbi:hypothetical protein PFLUV_G00007190 [Perca fluviatilis]|uniref:Uncharacterized protein n=1 Tax=Perca fluviatilis TaxID=8168 RepID=A0A6A5FNR6_PERFL|nr:hypothetical protein PFLUV_G00007190 [Perca fluviatilis]
MSGDLYAEPGIINKVYCEPDGKESIVNIYVSAESLRVYDNPWVEGMSPNTPRPAEPQHPVIRENLGKRNHVRADSRFLGVVCLLLLAGIIYLGVQMNKDKNKWRTERNQLLEDIANLKKTSDQLTANNTELIKERDGFLRMLCAKDSSLRSQKNLDCPIVPDKRKEL